MVRRWRGVLVTVLLSGCPRTDSGVDPQADAIAEDASVPGRDMRAPDEEGAVPDGPAPDLATAQDAAVDLSAPDAPLPDLSPDMAAMPDAAVSPEPVPEPIVDAALPDAPLPDVAPPDAALLDVAPDVYVCPLSDPCDDGDACTGGETCDGAGGCGGGSPVDCSPLADACNAASCDPASGCFATPINEGGSCDDGLFCTDPDQCAAGVCSGAARDCSMVEDACNGPGCDEDANACAPVPLTGVPCDDGLYCTDPDQCNAGLCSGTPRDCSAVANACNGPGCDEDANICVPVPLTGTPCEDGLYCTNPDQCDAGACIAGPPRDCSSAQNQCNSGSSCDEGANTCVGIPVADGTACNDGVSCTDPDTCTAGMCSGPGFVPIFAGAGDIVGELADGTDGDEETAALLDQLFPDGTPLCDGLVFALGDNVYPNNNSYTTLYEATWGRHKARTYPCAGNHEYGWPGPQLYYDYFGANAGDPATGYYSFNLGAWHVVVLNSNCADIGGCDAGSPQETWLRNDLTNNTALCEVAYWHHARWVGGNGNGNEETQGLWQAIYDHGVDVALGGHKHAYQHFAPQDENGDLDNAAGVRQFLVGVGGYGFHSNSATDPETVAAQNDTYGILKLTLHPTLYDYEFMSVAGGTFTDSGSANCH